ncbi:hypothetical protein GCM10020229_07140 [Kitasatospora albolonga]
MIPASAAMAFMLAPAVPLHDPVGGVQQLLAAGSSGMCCSLGVGVDVDVDRPTNQ